MEIFFTIKKKKKINVYSFPIFCIRSKLFQVSYNKYTYHVLKTINMHNGKHPNSFILARNGDLALIRNYFFLSVKF